MCSEQISSETGNITLTRKQDMISVIPGQQFQLPFEITDDYGSNFIGETVLTDTNATSRKKYFWGGNATLSGPENSNLLLTLDTLGDRIWHVNLLIKLKPCPPGLKPSEGDDIVCECSNGYGNVILCDHVTLNVTIKNQRWIGRQNWSEGSKGTCFLQLVHCHPSDLCQL